MKSLPSLSFRMLILELVVIAVFAVVGMREYLHFEPGLTLHGGEAEWLTSSAAYTSISIEKYGFIPLWQPYLSRGEPTFDSAFSFALSPLGIIPTLIAGYPSGVQITIVLSLVMAGFGGWYLARVLGFGSAARLLLGVMFAIKGPQHAAITMGYIQLGVTQGYLPWVAASAIAVVKFRNQRYPVVMLAFWITSLFLGGNIYYTLPALVMAILIMGAYLWRARTPEDRAHWLPFILDRLMLRRMLFTLGLTAALAGVTFVPVLLNSGYIGRHGIIEGWGFYAPLSGVIQQMFTPSRVFDVGTWNENYYIYTMPIWFALIVLVLVPASFFLRRFESKENDKPNQWRIWLVGLFILVFFTTWGAGANAIIGWANQNLPLIGRWRNVNRMLTMSSFWLAVYSALSIDMVMRYLNPAKYAKQLDTTSFQQWLRAIIRVGAAFGIVGLSLLAMQEVINQRLLYGSVEPEPALIRNGAAYIRAHDDEPIPSVWMLNYGTVTPFLREGVRFANISADFDPLGITPTLYPIDLSEIAPEWMILYDGNDQSFWGGKGWLAVEGSPLLENGTPSVWHNPDVVPYAFYVNYDGLVAAADEMPPEDVRVPSPTFTALVQPVTTFDWMPGDIHFNFTNPTDQRVVLIVQEVAWPGWTVRVDGQPAQLESVGQLIGVVVPPNSTQEIEFTFEAPILKIGAVITALTIVFIVFYMLRADLWLVRFRRPQPAPVESSVPQSTPANDALQSTPEIEVPHAPPIEESLPESE